MFPLFTMSGAEPRCAIDGRRFEIVPRSNVPFRKRRPIHSIGRRGGRPVTIPSPRVDGNKAFVETR